MTDTSDWIIVATRRRDVPHFNERWAKYSTGEKVYAIRKYNPKASYKNIRLSLTKQLKDRYLICAFLTPSNFDEEIEVMVYGFDKRGWPKQMGLLQDWIRP